MRPLLSALVPLAFAVVAADAQEEPPRRLDFSREIDAQERDMLPERQRRTDQEVRTSFVRSQVILGLASYAPAFAVMIGEEPATRLAAYLVMAGGTFFAATEVSRQVEISPARQVLSSRMGWRGSINGLWLTNAAGVRQREAAALTLLGGLGGAATGIALGNELAEGEAVAMVVGHDLMFLTALGLTYVFDPRASDGRGLGPGARVGIPMVLGWGGYALGRAYAGNAPYEVTAGDALLLWLGAGIGATAAAALIVESSPNTQAVAGTVLAGGLLGVWGADRWLVRRYDHTRAEGALVAIGGGAGALMGIGLGVLASGEAQRGSAPTFAFAALGAIGGVILTERYAQPELDIGRRYDVSSRVQFNPAGVFAAATALPGVHPILRITF